MRHPKSAICFVFYALISSFAVSLSWSPLVAAQQEAGTVVSVRDGVWVEREGARLPLASKDRIYPNDRIVTDESGKAQILFADDSLVALSANSSLAVNDFVFDSSSTPVFNAEVPKGVARFLTGKVVQQNRSGFSVETPQAVVGIRGTTFAVQVSDDGGTSVAGIDVNSALPIEVRNTVTGTASRIENAGEAIQATAQGSTRYQLASVPASQNPLSSEAAQGSELPAISWEEGAATTSVQSGVSGSVAADETSSIQIDTLPSFKDVVEDVLAGNGGGSSGGGGGTDPGNGGNPGGGGTDPGNGGTPGGGGGTDPGNGGTPGGGGNPGGGTGPINAQYTGTLTHGTGSTLAGTFSFDVSLSGATGTINNATMSVNQGIGENFHATGGSTSISGGNFTIDNFTSMTTNVGGLPSDPQAWMQGGITDTSTSGNWQIKNPVEWGSSMRHQGQFTGTP